MRKQDHGGGMKVRLWISAGTDNVLGSLLAHLTSKGSALQNKRMGKGHNNFASGKMTQKIGRGFKSTRLSLKKKIILKG